MKFFKKTDLIVILIIIAIGAAARMIYSSIFSGGKAGAEIYYNSMLVETIDLSLGEERIFSIPQKKNVVFHLDREGNIRFKESDCPDKICINAGKLHMAGQSAACLPNGIVLKIVPLRGRDKDEPDVIIGG